MLLMPSTKGLAVRTISHEMVYCTAHKTSAFLSLVVAHSLSHRNTQPLNLIKPGGSTSQTSGSGRNSSSSSRVATHPTGAGYLLYLPLSIRGVRPTPM